MSSKSTIASSLAKAIIFIIFVAAFTYLIYWLWQRQPRAPSQDPQTKKNDQVISSAQDQKSTFDPKSESIVKDANIRLKGKVTPSSYVAINSNEFQSQTKSDDSGMFESEIELEKGLNIFEISDFSQDLKENGKKTIIYYLATDKEKISGNTVYAGSAKNIFDNLLTIGTQEGEKKSRVAKLTDVITPQDEEGSKKEATVSVLSKVRIGDFVIALGKKDNEALLTTEKLEVIRENKPQVTTKLSAVLFVSDFKSNSIRGKDSNNNVIEFSTTKTTAILAGAQKAKNEEIKKDRKALIFFEDGDKKVVLKIFLI